MRRLRTLIFAASSLLLVVSALAQNPNVKQFAKDGLSFDYPANWQFSDQSTSQMQFIELAKGDVVIRIRSPREWLKTPEKELAAKKLFQDKYVSDFTSSVEQGGMHPKTSAITTQISGADAEGARVRAVLDGEPGGMDTYFRIISDRLVQMSILGSEKEITKSAAVWDLIRNSLKVEPPPQPKPTPQPSSGKEAVMASAKNLIRFSKGLRHGPHYLGGPGQMIKKFRVVLLTIHGVGVVPECPGPVTGAGFKTLRWEGSVVRLSGGLRVGRPQQSERSASGLPE